MNIGRFKISEFFVYKWRYYIGYGLLAIGLLLILIIIGRFLPGGLSNLETQSVVKSASIIYKDFWSANAINLPYHLAQHICFALFGISVFTIKLPSIILGFLTAVGLVLLLRQWFKPGIAILTSLIAITTGQFLFFAQNGTPDILFLFWPVWIIYIASLITNQSRFRKSLIAVFFVLAALSLYTPISVYILLVIFGSIAIHPHLRFLIKKIQPYRLAVGGVVLLLLIAPLAFAIIKTPQLGFTLLGIPPSWPDFGANLAIIGSQYFGFIGGGHGIIITPFFELGSLLLIALGAYFVIKTRVTAKNYIVTIWVLLLIPIVILNPSYTAITFLPLVILLSSGLEGLLSHWYQLFPRNPYARIGGLIPVILLVLILVSSGMNRYIYGYLYNPNIVPNFSKDLELIPKGTHNIVVSSSEQSFYNVVAEYKKQMVISTTPVSDTFLATRDAKADYTGYKIDRIITSSTSQNGDRFYIYKR
ncbi:MAG: glycosyltransferase family 39 protein [Candidatus Saccharibacteria bacterium]|nr:glycosyltransferase family 39 protein [Candidatus Saccharibacteria bacterium]